MSICGAWGVSAFSMGNNRRRVWVFQCPVSSSPFKCDILLFLPLPSVLLIFAGYLPGIRFSDFGIPMLAARRLSICVGGVQLFPCSRRPAFQCVGGVPLFAVATLHVTWRHPDFGGMWLVRRHVCHVCAEDRISLRLPSRMFTSCWRPPAVLSVNVVCVFAHFYSAPASGFHQNGTCAPHRAVLRNMRLAVHMYSYARA